MLDFMGKYNIAQIEQNRENLMLQAQLQSEENYKTQTRQYLGERMLTEPRPEDLMVAGMEAAEHWNVPPAANFSFEQPLSAFFASVLQ